jgi:hypothetical protein
MSQQQISRRELEDLSVLPFKAAAGFVKRHPIPTGFWLLGLGLCFLFTGFVVPKESYDRYESGLANLNEASLDSLMTSWEDWKEHEKNYQMSKGWFWSCDRICLGHKSAHDQAYVEYTRLQAMYDQSHAELKGELGVFSTFGVEEARQSFNEKYQGGKAFAKRQTTWDAMFMSIGYITRGRDETFMDYALKLLFHFIVNFFMGLFGAVVTFMWSLWAIIKSFHTSGPEGLLFFAGASLAAISFALSFCVGLYGAASGMWYVGLKAVSSNQRLEGARNHHRVH